MGARQKLNTSYLAGSVLVAGLFGWLTGSWLIFLVVLIFLLACNVHTGDIRPGPRRP